MADCFEFRVCLAGRNDSRSFKKIWLLFLDILKHCAMTWKYSVAGNRISDVKKSYLSNPFFKYIYHHLMPFKLSDSSSIIYTIWYKNWKKKCNIEGKLRQNQRLRRGPDPKRHVLRFQTNVDFFPKIVDNRQNVEKVEDLKKKQ